jgi:hypothetical protein
MKLSGFFACTLSYCAVSTVLAACGGTSGSPPVPSSQFREVRLDAAGGPPYGGVVTVRSNDARSWMSPDAKTKALLYVSNLANNTVSVFSYPEGKPVGVLTTDFASPDGVCVDKKQNIWIVNNGNDVLVEYKHGGTSPIATLTGYAADDGCSVDPMTGNLAVTSYGIDSSGGGGVSIFAHAKGSLKFYTDSQIPHFNWCGYDDKGNLYVDGTNASQTSFQFAVLPKGKNAFKNITLKGGTIYYPGQVQWDGKYVAVGDQEAGGASYVSAIYQTTGVGGKIVHETPLDAGGLESIVEFWIAGKVVVGPNEEKNNVGFYKYPAGGKPTKTLTKGLDYDQGSAISE